MDAATQTPHPPEDSPAGILDLLALLLRHPRALFAFPTATAVVVALICLLLPAQYTAVTTFVPEVSAAQRLPAGLSGVAGQLGISLGEGATASPRFFAEVLQSREIRERVLQTRFAAPDGPAGDSLPLLQILGVSGDNLADSLQEGTRELAELVGIGVDAETNILTLRVTTHDRRLSAAVANALISYLNDFNTDTRQSKGRERRQFVESRLAVSAEELKAAELGLKNFYDRNRLWQQAPNLVFEEGRLRRTVEVKQQVYLTLAREFEEAQIDEVNDTPGITVIDPAVPVEERSFPRPVLFGVMAMVLAVAGAISWILAVEFLARLRGADPLGYARLVGALTALRRQPRGSGGTSSP